MLGSKFKSRFKFTIKSKLIGMSLLLMALSAASSGVGTGIMRSLGGTVQTMTDESLPAVVLLGSMQSQVNAMDRDSVLTALLSMTAGPGAAGASAQGQDAPPAGDAARQKNDAPDSQPGQETVASTRAGIQSKIAEIEKDLATYETNYLENDETEEIAKVAEFKQNWSAYKEAVMAASGITPGGTVPANISTLYANTLKLISELNAMNSEEAQALLDASRSKASAGTWTHLILGLLVLLVGIGGAVYLSRSITRPLLAIVKQVKSVTAGNLRVEPLAVKSKDEIGELAADFDGMCRSLRSTISTVIENALHVASTSEQLSASAEHTSAATERIAESAGELADGARIQLERVSATNATASGVSANIASITDRFNTVAALIAEAEDKASKGNAVIRSTIEQMRGVQEKVTQSSDSVTVLARKSEEISHITSLIKDISAQTNLLSLNAAIEAARAGEQGMGFAVVAGEVRKLANQSEEATKMITALVEEIISSTRQVMLSMNDGVQSLSVGMAHVDEAGTSFYDIASSVQQVGSEAKIAAGEAQSVTQHANAMAESINEIAEIADRATSSAQVVSGIVEGTMASMQEVSAGSATLAKMADGLSDAVSTFKV